MAENVYKGAEYPGRKIAHKRYSMESPGNVMSQKSEEAPQCDCDKRGPDYDNNTPSNWLRGMPSAEGKPGFDKGK